MKVKSEREVAQLCLTLCDPLDHNLPGPTVQGILQARVLEWVATAISRLSYVIGILQYVIFHIGLNSFGVCVHVVACIEKFVYVITE